MPCCCPNERTDCDKATASGWNPDGLAHAHSDERGPGAAEPSRCIAVQVSGVSPVKVNEGRFRSTCHEWSPTTSDRCSWCSRENRAESSMSSVMITEPTL